MNDRELMQQALDALEAQDCAGFAATIEAIRARLAQPEQADCDGGVCGIGGYCDKCPRLAQDEPPCKTGAQCIGGECERCIVEPEPVAEVHTFIGSDFAAVRVTGDIKLEQPLYTAPPQRKPLTDAQVDDCIEEALGNWYWATRSAAEQDFLHKAARAIEAAHGIGEKK